MHTRVRDRNYVPAISPRALQAVHIALSAIARPFCCSTIPVFDRAQPKVFSSALLAFHQRARLVCCLTIHQRARLVCCLSSVVSFVVIARVEPNHRLTQELVENVLHIRNLAYQEQYENRIKDGDAFISKIQRVCDVCKLCETVGRTGPVL